MSKKRILTEEQLAQAKKRREEFAALCKKAAAMEPEARVKALADMPVTTTEGRSLSPTNQMLVLLQNPDSTIVGGFRQWIKQGRCVGKGQHGMSIWIPRSQKEGQEGQEGKSPEANQDPSFFMGTVFDISQTVELQKEE